MALQELVYLSWSGRATRQAGQVAGKKLIKYGIMTKRAHFEAEHPIPPISDWVEIARVTTVGTEISIPIPQNLTKIGFWIVGGGSSGRSEWYDAHWGGQGGNGGQAIAFECNKSENSLIAYVGAGGNRTATGTNKAANAGQSSYVIYNNSTYTANGGTGVGSSNTQTNTKTEYSGLGGRGCGLGNPQSYHYKSSENEPYGVLGEDGLENPFDHNDISKYGCGGSAGFNSYAMWNSYYSTYPDGFTGSDSGGGGGGYGPDNSTLNAGRDATFYGAGGGGGAFSSNHRYGSGGAGYQGIVIIYGK